MMPTDAPVVAKRKLIEVALPLDAINKASAREKSIRHGHPSTLHLWWARRPLAAARAVIFAQMVDDPSANPDLFPTEAAQEKERQRLFGIIEELVKWENTTNETVLQQARDEIWQSWRRTCAANADHPRADELFDRNILPAFHDPFAGGGSLPLEAQRLGLEAHASDLNPVAVLINKAMIEIPPKFAGKPPVNPDSNPNSPPAQRGEMSRSDRGGTADRLIDKTWRGAEGLADDVRYYGQWMRDEAERRIGHLYPKVRVTAEMAADRPDLEPYVGRELTVIAWLWARTVKSPNPAFADVDVPLASTFILSKKKGKEAWVEPVIEEGGYRFEMRTGEPPESAKGGTKVGRGANFRCVLSGSVLSDSYVKSESSAGRMGTRLLAMVATAERERLFLSPDSSHEELARTADPDWRPVLAMSTNPRWFSPPAFGMKEFGDIFTDRQLVALNTFSGLVAEARERVKKDADSIGLPDDGVRLGDGGIATTSYADAVSVYLAFVVDRCADYWTSLGRWQNAAGSLSGMFSRQAIPMVWDFPEVNVFSDRGGSYSNLFDWSTQSIPSYGLGSVGQCAQADARDVSAFEDAVVSTDPPYYDNIGYADLSDFLYTWLRRAVQDLFPDLFSMLEVPKSDELIATPHRHASRQSADKFFLQGMTTAMRNLAENSHPGAPSTIYYAFKQSELRADGDRTSTGWETFLSAVLDAGLRVNGTWPIRTEMSNRMVGMGTNALASSVILVCRPRRSDAQTATRREFQERLKAQFPDDLAHLQRSNIAPVDLAQASIGPGMRIFTEYDEVLNADGSAMTVREALALINATLDEVLAEQEGDFDPDTRWALTWFEQHGFEEGEFGDADTLSKAKGTSVEGVVQAGLAEARRGDVRLLRASELDEDWDPATDRRPTVWEMAHHLIRRLESEGESAAAELAAALGSQAETARDLAYRLYVVSDRMKRPADARQYNALVQSWPEIMRLAQLPSATARQSGLEFAEE